MPPVAVVTDSTSYLPPELVERHGIGIVPLYVVFGGDRTVKEVEITDFPAFFEELRHAEQLPTTSQPSVGDFTSVYEPLLAAGKEIVSVHISGGLSGTPEAARQAKEALTRDHKGGEHIEIVDSTTAAGGLGFMVLAAAKAARDGASAKEAAEHVAAARKELRLWFAIDTLEFLRRGGRIGAASAWIGSTLKVKPILTVENQMTPVERVRTSSRAFERMVDYARQRHDSGADAWSAQHINAPDQCAALVERCTAVFECEPTIVSEIGDWVGTRAQPMQRIGEHRGAGQAKVRSRRTRAYLRRRPLDAQRQGDRARRADRRVRGDHPLPAVPVAKADHLAPDRALPRRGAVAARQPARQQDEARARDHDRVPRPARDPGAPDRADRPAADHRGEQLRRERAGVRARRNGVRARERPPARAERGLRHHEQARGGGGQAAGAPRRRRGHV